MKVHSTAKGPRGAPSGGSQYASDAYGDLLTTRLFVRSMSRKGNCWDNAPTESLWGSLKVGRLHGRRFETRRAAMDEIVDWLTFYNHRRLHSSLGYQTPATYERAALARRLPESEEVPE